MQLLIKLRLSNLSILSEPDEAYSRNASGALHLISMFLFKRIYFHFFFLFFNISLHIKIY